MKKDDIKPILMLIVIIFFGVVAYTNDGKDNTKESSSSAIPESVQVQQVSEPAQAARNTQAKTTGEAEQSAPSDKWEPIGKYDKKEIHQASEYLGSIHDIIKNIDKDRKKVIVEINLGMKKRSNKKIEDAIDEMLIDSERIEKKVNALMIPELNNKQAEGYITLATDAVVEKLTTFKSQSDSFKEFKEKKGNVDIDSMKASVKKSIIEDELASSDASVNTRMAYLSYGYTDDEINDSTGKIKNIFNPSRVENVISLGGVKSCLTDDIKDYGIVGLSWNDEKKVCDNIKRATGHYPSPDLLKNISTASFMLKVKGYDFSVEDIARQLTQIITLRNVNADTDEKAKNTLDIVYKAYTAWDADVTPVDIISFLYTAGISAASLSNDGLVGMLAMVREENKGNSK